MTDNTQELDEILAVFANYDDSYEPGYEEGVLSRIDRVKKNIIDWHNKQMSELLDRLDKRIDYNKHDLGELGEFIRIKYAHNFIETERNRLNPLKSTPLNKLEAEL